jgi:hypothetical protein
VNLIFIFKNKEYIKTHNHVKPVKPAQNPWSTHAAAHVNAPRGLVSGVDGWMEETN